MEKKKIVIISIFVGIVATGLALYLKNKAKIKKVSEENNLLDEGISSDVKSVVSNEFPIKKGSKGEKVKLLQKYINTKIKPPLAILVTDGIFGNGTERALKSITGKIIMTKDEFNKVIPYTTT
jgi:hypothetical protein